MYAGCMSPEVAQIRPRYFRFVAGLRGGRNSDIRETTRTTDSVEKSLQNEAEESEFETINSEQIGF